MGRHAHVIERNMRRDEMAASLAKAANRAGIKTTTAASSNIFIAENINGQLFTVTVAYKQQQQESG